MFDNKQHSSAKDNIMKYQEKEYRVVNLLNGLVQLVIADNKWQAMHLGIKWFGTKKVGLIQ